MPTELARGVVLAAAAALLAMTACAADTGTGEPVGQQQPGEGSVPLPEGISDEELERRIGERGDPGIGIGGPIVDDPDSLRMLEFRLEAPKSSYVLGEPVVLSGFLVNVGGEPVEVAPLLDPTLGYTRVEIARPGEGLGTFLDPFWLDEGMARLRTVQPGEVVGHRIEVYLGADGLTFDAPGTYVVTARFESVESNAVELEVVAPRDDAEARAAEILLRRDVATFLFAGGGEHLGEARTGLEFVSAELAGTPHAAYANYGLSLYWSLPGRDFEEGVVREADPDQALQFLAAAQAAGLVAPLEIDAYSTAVTGLGLAESPRAAQVFAEFQERFADDPLAQLDLEGLELQFDLGG